LYKDVVGKSRYLIDFVPYRFLGICDLRLCLSNVSRRKVSQRRKRNENGRRDLRAEYLNNKSQFADYRSSNLIVILALSTSTAIARHLLVAQLCATVESWVPCHCRILLLY
jgi:hypothetical protein